MKIRSHSESHLVELEDGSRWRISPAISIWRWTRSPRRKSSSCRPTMIWVLSWSAETQRSAWSRGRKLAGAWGQVGVEGRV